ncbi:MULTISPECIES: ABC transporter permease [Caproicibacterium]|uniref:ABC transporter permease subunit n=1 Tax=Caproicibacterium argilliputei TaxID=3030016 RepID=A0AA97H2I9_9FIRM|nr:ABC transporter permease subunit [Caproicibacterium argilliputei]WOC32730.1 ABC transporter permease subunit [Caproicibacterium argilliputei]
MGKSGAAASQLSGRKRNGNGGFAASCGGSHKRFSERVFEQKELILLTLPFVVLLFVFNYVPLWGWIMAFQNYKPGLGIFQSEWVGLANFKALFGDSEFYIGIRNTLGISILKLVTGYAFSILLAVLINEVRVSWFKRTVQTISYLPHFVSWVVVSGIVYSCLSTDGGVVNTVLLHLHLISKPISFMGTANLFWGIMAGSDLWKEVGWNSIIYIAAMSGIDSSLYEAADMDGAGRLRKIFHITLPGILPTVKILLILSIGSILNVGFEQTLLLSNSQTLDYSQTLELYVYNYGMEMGRYSFATAAGIFNSVVSLVLVTTFNKLSRVVTGESAF